MAQDGHALQFASKEMQGDREVVMEALAQDGILWNMQRRCKAELVMRACCGLCNMPQRRCKATVRS